VVGLDEAWRGASFAYPRRSLILDVIYNIVLFVESTTELCLQKIFNNIFLTHASEICLYRLIRADEYFHTQCGNNSTTVG
jgi:hypothetical protein